MGGYPSLRRLLRLSFKTPGVPAGIMKQGQTALRGISVWHMKETAIQNNPEIMRSGVESARHAVYNMHVMNRKAGFKIGSVCV
jgi:hypothetical protein